jgi:hypothetical protein
MSEVPRNYLTAEEFLAQIEAHRQERLSEPPKKSQSFIFGPPHRTYVLDWSRVYVPPRPKLIIPEDML